MLKKQNNKNKSHGERTIRAETTRVFVMVFSLLAILGIFEISASYSGSQSFGRIKDIHLKSFQLANAMSEEARDLIGVFYLATGESDIDLQLEHMMRYKNMTDSFSKAHTAFEEILKEVPDSEAKNKSIEIGSEIKKVFAAINATSQAMMLASMEGRKDDAKGFFFEVNKQIEKFKAQIQNLKINEQNQLDLEVSGAQHSLNRTTIVAIVLTVGSIILALVLINHLMRFLAISLLPISNLMHNLKQAVFSIDASGKVQSPASAFSTTLFEEEIVGRRVTESVYSKAGMDEEKILELEKDISESFGCDAINWLKLKSRLPKTLHRSINGGPTKTLSLTYTPLWDEQGKLQNIMFVVEDDTEVEYLREKERKLQLDSLAQKMESERKEVEIQMQGELLKLAQEKNKVLHSLRLEAESKFSLASEVAHRLNNPLNYIKTSMINICSVRDDLWQKCMLLLQSDGEESPELVMVRNEYSNIFGNFDQAISVMSTGVEKAADCIGDIRGLSGVDGYAIDRIEVDIIWQKVRQRLVEVLDNATYERLTFTLDRNSRLNFYCNKHLFKSCLEMVLQFVCTHTTEKVLVNLLVEGSEHDLKLQITGKFSHISPEEWQALETNVSRILRGAMSRLAIEPHLGGVNVRISQRNTVAVQESA